MKQHERAILGGLLREPARVPETVDLLQVKDFSDHELAKIYDSIIQVHDSGLTPDLVTVADFAPDVRADVLAALTDEVPAASNIEWYIEQVKADRTRRELSALATKIEEWALDDSVQPSEAVERAQMDLIKLVSTNGGYESYAEADAEAGEEIERAQQMGGPQGIETGFHRMNAMLGGGLQDGSMVIIGGRPSSGKSALALNMAVSIARRSIPVGFFSAEMPRKSLSFRMLAADTEIHATSLRAGRLTSAQMEQVALSRAELQALPLLINDEANISLHKLKAAARSMVLHGKAQVIFVDYLNLITPDSRYEKRHEQVAAMSASLKMMARELKVPVVVVAQIRREADGKAPMMSDLRESGNIEQDADVIMLLQRQDVYFQKDVLLHVVKNREGMTGMLEYRFEAGFTRFTETIRFAGVA